MKLGELKRFLRCFHEIEVFDLIGSAEVIDAFQAESCFFVVGRKYGRCSQIKAREEIFHCCYFIFQ
jgi:hypothetical protein